MQTKILSAFAISLAVTALLMITCNPIYGGGKSLFIKQLDRSGNTIADEAGRTVKNTKGEVGHATKDVVEDPRVQSKMQKASPRVLRKILPTF